MRIDLLPTDMDGKLAKIVEECGEFLQAYGKYIRHGAKATDPVTGLSYDNLADIGNELTDLVQSVDNFIDVTTMIDL